MTSIQEARLTMYNAVISFCKQNATIIATIPALQASLVSFTDIAASISSIAKQRLQIISGIAIDKNVFRKSLALLASSIASTVFAYANSINNNELREQVNFSHTELLRLRDEELPAACANIIASVNPYLVPLAAYNITADTLSNFNDLIKEYTLVVPRPRNAVSQRRAHVTSLKELFRTADNILKNQMDKIIAPFKTTNPEFYKPYKYNRSIVDAGSTPTQIKGTITNNNTSETLSGVLIEVLENATTVRSGADGKFVIKPLTPGVYSIKTTKEGYQPKIMTNLTVKLGQIKTIDMALSPVV